MWCLPSPSASRQYDLSTTHQEHHPQSGCASRQFRQPDLRISTEADYADKMNTYEPLTPVSLDGKESEKLESPLTHLPADCSNVAVIRYTLEQFFCLNTELLNTRQYDKAMNLDGYDQDFTAAMPNQKAESLEGWVDHHRRGAQQFPQAQVRILSMNSKVDLKKGTASLFTDLELTGRPPGVTINSMTISEFKICDGKWLCMRATGMRGNGSIV